MIFSVPISILLFIGGVIAFENELGIIGYSSLFASLLSFVFGLYMHCFGYRVGGTEEEWKLVNNELFYKQPTMASTHINCICGHSDKQHEVDIFNPIKKTDTLLFCRTPCEKCACLNFKPHTN